MYAINDLLILEKEDVSDLQLMTNGEFDQTTVSKESLTKLLASLQEKADGIPDDADVGDFMMKTIISEGVQKIAGQLSMLPR